MKLLFEINPSDDSDDIELLELILPESVKCLFEAIDDHNFNPSIIASDNRIAHQLMSEFCHEFNLTIPRAKQTLALDQFLILIEVFNYLAYNGSFPDLI